ncbi:MAG: SGNH/GDSL hydrolase family protein [Ilumatobacter sp.]|nr:SGNH/GDSL hydrolase family protein [Ilumatobacter sp.]
MERALLGLVIVAGLSTAACGDGDSAVSTLPDVPPTVALGPIPEPPTPISSTVVPDTVPPPTTIPEVEPITGPVGEVADGDRLLLIGDSAMLTLTPRADGIACDVLGDIGWQVDIEAELGRYVNFADEVVDELVVDAGDQWHVVGLMFGHQLDTSVEEFGDAVREVLDQIGSIPVLLYTRSEVDDASAELNEVIRDIADERPNVVLVDWGQAVADELELDLVDDDGLPTSDGMERITLLTAAALGESPTGAGGLCFEPTFDDDSAIIV